MDPISKHLPVIGASAKPSDGTKPSTDSAASAPEQVALLVERMLRCFHRKEGVDPQVFASAIVGILLDYPMEIVMEITDPIHGLPARQQFMPSPYDVRQACEARMRPRRESAARQVRVKAQLDERKAIAEQRAAPERKQTLAEIQVEMRQRGLKGFTVTPDLPEWLR